MKKTYQNPKSDFLTISLEEMIAASNYGQPEQGFNLNDLGETSATSGNLSRRSVWEDEDFDDEF